jgi:signal transduction histidine kinase/CHASE3 domain sensor protein
MPETPRVTKSIGTMQVAALLLLTLLLIGAAFAVAGVRGAEHWVRHTEEVRLELAQLQGVLIDAETGERGYLATGDPKFLEPYTHTLAAWRGSFDGVRALLADNPSQEQRLRETERLIEHDFDVLRGGMAARDGGASGAALVPLVAEGKRTMDAIRASIGDMQREEEALDQERRRESTRREYVLVGFLFAAGAALALVGVSARVMRSRQERAERERLVERVRDEERLRRLAAENAALEARARAEAAERVRREFLAKAGEALVSSLDYRTTLATVARLAVPELADWCSVELIDPGAARPQQVAVAHVDPSKVQLARELGERYPPDPDATTGVAQAIRSGKSQLYAELPPALLERSARDDEHLRIIRELRLESAMVVPLAGRERVLGAMSFVYAASGRHYTESDLAFAEDFARRAAMAIENAQAHAAVSAALEFQERFVAVLGHDLRNPLAAIDMARGILSQRAAKANDADATRILARIETSSRRMTRMVQQILDVARTRLGGGLEVVPTSVDLSVVLAGVIAELRTAHPSRTIDLHGSPLVGSWDRDRLEQVFSNLIGNAINHGDPGKPVTVRANGEDGEVRVEVHNDGPPIPDELRSRLFLPFRRGSKESRTAKTDGLGLGLFISHEIVATHGGRLEAESTATTGTTFRVTLPRITPAVFRGRVEGSDESHGASRRG